LKEHTRILADFIARVKFEDLSHQVIEKAKECILDTFGCALAGSASEEVAAMIKGIKAYDEGAGSVLWGSNLRSSLFSSCLVNGAMAHCLEMDDVHRKAKVHPGTAVIPAVLGLGEKLGSGGRAILLGTVLGYEATIRIGVALGAKGHRMKGWHATGTCGTFGAAAGCAKLLGLNSEQTADALGLAGTQSSGLWAFTADGSMSKRLHPGRAAQSGVYAGILAQGGFTGPKRILEAEDGGFFQAFSDHYDLDSVSGELGKKFEILEISVKPYPCCRTLHGPLDVILRLKKRERIQPERIKAIRVRTYEVALNQCGYTNEPSTPVDAQFSMPYALSAALWDGEIGLAQFKVDRIHDEKTLCLAKKVELAVDQELDKLYPAKWSFIIQVEMMDGKLYVERIDTAKGDPDDPLSRGELERKFLNHAGPVLGVKRGERLAQLILRLEELKDINLMIKLCIPELQEKD
jgi:2-methylcitrate dehydratase PrpD